MLAKFFRDRRGNFTILSAVMLTSLVGVTGLAVDYGNGLYNRLKDQRVADIAAAAGARVYEETQSDSAVAAAVTNVAALNGVSSGAISDAIVNSPTGDGNKAVNVIVTSQAPLTFARVLQPSRSAIPVQASSWAEMKSGGQGCIVALNQAGTGVTVTSASGITADACAVESDSTVTASSASDITTIAIDYDTTPPTATGGSTIAAPPGKTLSITKAPVTDPLAGNSGVATATARLGTVEALTSPAAPPPVTSQSGNLSYSASTFIGTLPAGCSQSHSGSTWSVTCSSIGPFNIGSLSVTSTANVSFNTSGSPLTVYNFIGGITVSSSGTLAFGPGTFNVEDGITVASASKATFGAGTFDIGPGTTACTDGGKYSLCIESATSLTLGGPSNFTFGGGVYAGSSATIKLGSGTTNSYAIGSSSNGNSAVASSASNLLFADATSGSNTFQLVGNVTAASAACVALPVASEHDIKGAVIANSASNTTLGAGVYTVSGYLDNESASGGGGCSGWSGGTSGSGVTFVLGATTTPASGACQSMAICVLSASHSSMVAPSGGPTAGLVVIGPTSPSNTAGGLFESASSGSFSGAVYIPNGPVKISSASGLGGGSGVCLMLIAAQITVTSASATGSTCTGVDTAPAAGNVVLVQ
ncbi:MAG: pilus assembly protein TadG-related protein [Rhizomicrobium sp.]